MYTTHRWESDKYFNFGYIKYLPKDYDPTKKYPLVFFLHGSGERGDDIESVAIHGYMKYVKENNADYPFIYIAPQCPEDKFWACYTESLIAFIDYLTETLPVDKGRIYLTGISMGGAGAWMLAMAAPEKFAALVPICGPAMFWNTEVIKDIPTYIFHGDCDPCVPLTESITMLQSINMCGGNAKMQIYHGVGHNSWEYAYTDDNLLKWMLEQKKTNYNS